MVSEFPGRVFNSACPKHVHSYLAANGQVRILDAPCPFSTPSSVDAFRVELVKRGGREAIIAADVVAAGVQDARDGAHPGAADSKKMNPHAQMMTMRMKSTMAISTRVNDGPEKNAAAEFFTKKN